MGFKKLPKKALYIFGTLTLLSNCSTLPTQRVKKYSFPPDAQIGVPEKSYAVIGIVKTKVNFSSLDPDHEDSFLCQNYFNKAAIDLVKRAKEKHADAVIDVKSVVFHVDGKISSFPRPECSDDGQEGQVLAQGIAIRWAPEGNKALNNKDLIK